MSYHARENLLRDVSLMAVVLVVDDLPQIRQLVRVTLGSRGHRVVQAEDGIRALQMMREAPPDLVVMDVAMPGPSGLDVCRLMRRDPALAALPVIILTASGQTERDALRAGATAFLDKPFSPMALLALVASLLGDCPRP
jgi:CheY-like chemotaxis protein